jgi:hypothetical protein
MQTWMPPGIRVFLCRDWAPSPMAQTSQSVPVAVLIGECDCPLQNPGFVLK